MIFIKEARCFEVKKANHELEAHSYEGGEKENEDGKMMVVMAENMKEKKGRNVGFFVKLMA